MLNLFSLGTGAKPKPDERHKRHLLDLYQLDTRVNAGKVIKASHDAGASDAKVSLLAKIADYRTREAENELEQYAIRVKYAQDMNRIESKAQRLDAKLRRSEAQTALSQAENIASLGGYEEVFQGTNFIDL